MRATATAPPLPNPTVTAGEGGGEVAGYRRSTTAAP